MEVLALKAVVTVVLFFIFPFLSLSLPFVIGTRSEDTGLCALFTCSLFTVQAKAYWIRPFQLTHFSPTSSVVYKHGSRKRARPENVDTIRYFFRTHQEPTAGFYCTGLE